MRKNLLHKRVFLKNDTCLVGAVYEFAKDDAHHWATVLRAKPGQELEIVCTSSRKLFKARLCTVSKNLVNAEIIEKLPSIQNLPHLELIAAACKTKSLENMLEKATELSTRRIYLWNARHSVNNIEEKKRERLERIIAHAAAQSKQLFIPELFIANNQRELEVHMQQNNIKNMHGFLCSLAPDASPANNLNLKQSDSMVLSIGPEGDFTPEEEEFFINLGFRALSLGNSILKADTAAVAGISMLKARCQAS